MVKRGKEKKAGEGKEKGKEKEEEDLKGTIGASHIKGGGARKIGNI